MINDIPPKQTLSGSSHTPTDPPNLSSFDHLPHADAQPGALVSMHDSALHGDANAFPVLKAFQDYLEQERQQARKRLVTLTAFFVCVLALVVGGFIVAFVYLFSNMAKREDRLLEAALQEKKVALAPVVAQQTAAALEARQLEAVALNLQTNLGTQLATVGAVASKLDSRVEEQNKEMARLQATLADLKKENDKLRTEMPKLALDAARKLTPPTPPTPPKPVAPPALVAQKPPAVTSSAQPSTTTPPVSIAPPATGTVAAAMGKTLTGYADVTLAIQEHGNPKTTIPWRVFLPPEREPANF